MKIFLRFLLVFGGASNDHKKIHCMSWKQMWLPKDLGGLNFRDLESFNKALLTKKAWRFLQHPDLLVSRVIKAKYFSDSSLFEAEAHTHYSYFWKSFL